MERGTQGLRPRPRSAGGGGRGVVPGSCAPLGRSGGCLGAPPPPLGGQDLAGVLAVVPGAPIPVSPPRRSLDLRGRALACLTAATARQRLLLRGVSECRQESPSARTKTGPHGQPPSANSSTRCRRRGPAGAGDPRWELAAGGLWQGERGEPRLCRNSGWLPDSANEHVLGGGIGELRACGSLVTEINVYIWWAVTLPTVLASEDSRTCGRCRSPPPLCVHSGLLLEPEALGRSNEEKGR